MANRATAKNQQMFKLKGFDENDLMMGVMLSQKPGYDLIQNCDLPPPTKVFSGLSNNVTVTSSLNRKKVHNFGADQGDVLDDDGDRKLGLLKALSLSQTRAREAEAKYAAITKERDAFASAFAQNSMQIFAYRKFVQFLEFQVSQFQIQQQQEKVPCGCGKRKQGEEGEESNDGSGSNGLTLLMTMAFCLGIAGVGFAIGCSSFYSKVI